MGRCLSSEAMKAAPKTQSWDVDVGGQLLEWNMEGGGIVGSIHRCSDHTVGSGNEDIPKLQMCSLVVL